MKRLGFLLVAAALVIVASRCQYPVSPCYFTHKPDSVVVVRDSLGDSVRTDTVSRHRPPCSVYQP